MSPQSDDRRDGRGAPLGNRNAAKDNPLNAQITLKLTRAERDAAGEYNRQHRCGGLSALARQALLEKIGLG